MPRIARVVAESVPHHITQHGNGRQTVFDDAQDHHVYLKLLREYTLEHGLHIWAWCLMRNHVHLLAVPRQANRCLALSAAFMATMPVIGTFVRRSVAPCGPAKSGGHGRLRNSRN